MTRQEVKEMLMVLQAAYPNYNPQDKTIAVNTWYDMLCGYPAEKVNAAVKAYILSDTSGFAPSIGQIVEKMQLFCETETRELNEMAAWQLVLRAMRNSIYHAEEEFTKWPPVVQKAVVSPGQLREWAMSEDVDGTWMNVTQSNFMRTYRVEVARDKEMQKLSPDILKLISKTQNQNKISQPENKTLTVAEERKLAEQSATQLTGRLRVAYKRDTHFPAVQHAAVYHRL